MVETSRDKQWERSNSWWIIWTFIPGLNWISFLYAGFKVKQTRWKLWGLLYFILFAIFGSLTEDSASPLDWLILVYWIVPIIHVFRIRKEYLTHLKNLQESRLSQATDSSQRAGEQVGAVEQGAGPAQDHPQTSHAAAQGGYRESPPVPPPIPTSDHKPNSHSGLSTVDLNRSSEQELATLPGIGVILAKRAISLRESRGGFHSVEDFGKALKLRSHTVERIRPLVSVSAVHQSQRPHSSGRIVDY